MLIFYNLFVYLYYCLVNVASIWNTKAKEWVDGRKDWKASLTKQMDQNSPWIWVHCASAGEFEQGKPVIERLKQTYSGYKILVSFFSPSGYSVGKKYKYADAICYLPLDTSKNAAKLLKVVNPKLVIFIKYDYWYHHLKAIADNKIPLLLVSAIFRESQPFFKWYGGLHRKILSFFSQLFVQDAHSKERLQSIAIEHVTVSGDTRFDRVAGIADNFEKLAHIEDFINNNQVLVAGSTWPEDEELIKSSTSRLKLKLIIAPHEINKAHIESLIQLFPDACKYSNAASQDLKNYSILIIDNVGMLSRLYRYADITYIGGGFNKSGIHNTLEAAVWGKPVLFGPNYQKFKEARELIQNQAAYSITNTETLSGILQELLENTEKRQQSGLSAQSYVKEQKGATDTILNHIQEKRLLTS